MILRALRHRRQPAAAGQLPPVVHALTEGCRVYAIGDVHGHADLLGRMLETIDAEEARRPPATWTVELFLGDVIDRGPESRGVVDMLIEPPGGGRHRVCLRGNHEDCLLRFLAEPTVLATWRAFGGLETLASYGLSHRPLSTPEDFDAARIEFINKLPPAHKRFFEQTWLFYEQGGFFFAHAGVRPGVLLSEQTAEDLMYIRGPFVSYHGDFGKRIVHGHTPVAAVEVLPNRINVDTGAYATGRLSCVVIEGDRVDVLSVSRMPLKERA
ncbi:serine/threonine protein phosphatase [Blastochloris sulfoviridis]|uniref:Serine/threonine protein phosphatase n=1 Tax=Blastochloris sulfoviridis TaxID=50712 RepID=A0A5M6I4P3_9HYPH|nr:serine/threonine protein phosphatase [Blastochloris sulfoviridis]